jgi:hypothetical protein
MLSHEQNQVQRDLPESFILLFTPFFILYSLCPSRPLSLYNKKNGYNSTETRQKPDILSEYQLHLCSSAYPTGRLRLHPR